MALIKIQFFILMVKSRRTCWWLFCVCFDITDYVKNDAIKIKVETVNIDTASIPVNSDFTHWAGLYRDVELIATSDAYISTEDNGTKGIYVSQSFSGNNAIAKIKTKFSSKGNEDKDYKVVTTILDNEGQVSKKNKILTY